MAHELFNIDVIVKFSKFLRLRMGWCEYSKNKITYNDLYMRENYPNIKVIDNTIIHEVLHLRYHDDNSPEFRRACACLGVDPVHSPRGVKHVFPFFQSECPECGWKKKYYHFPKHLRGCPECKNDEIEIRER